MYDPPGKNFGERLSGVLCAPISGDYEFWIAGNDQAQLWLGPDDSSAHKKLIAQVRDWTYYREWGRSPEQQSAVIRLIAGQRYYIEVLHKADGTNDHVAVAWRGPGFSRRPIVPDYLHAGVAN